ncbi:MAG: PIN domain-containing protein [Armatimonadota bacterium]|nr:PIN domain-containing protein [bacterium]MDW8320200.1 PIN domain-containing protein [Armatimonadota bacterium]
MAGLKLAKGATVYLDANILVYVVESHHRYRPVLEPLLEQAQTTVVRLITSQLTILECLIVPMRVDNHVLIEAYRQALMASDLVLVPVTLEVLMEAASLRAKYPALRTPDAIHWATMRIQKADLLLTNDLRLARAIGSGCVLLDDLI